MARKDKKAVEFNMDTFNFDDLASDAFGSNVTTAKLSSGIQSKIFVVYGTNNSGKTKQCSRMVKNSFIIPLEAGTNGISGNKILKTASWADFRKHVKTLTTNKQLLTALEHGVEIGVIIDGLENGVMYCKDYICDKNNVEEIGQIPHGGGYPKYEKEMHTQITKLSKCGYTLFFIGHPAPVKDGDGYVDLAVDRRASKIVKDIADFVIYVESNGTDPETKQVIPSSAYLTEYKGENGFFGRCRFPYVQTEFEVWDADIMKQAIHDGIVKQAEIEGAELATFQEVNEKYESSFELSFDEAMDEIYDMLDKLDEAGQGGKADEILLNYLDDVDALKDLKGKQIQTVQSIYEDLQDFIDELEDQE